MTPATRAKGRISRVTFNAALKTVWTAFEDSEPQRAYAVLSSYLNAWLAGLRKAEAEDQLTNPTLFKAVVFLFPDVAQRVNDRHGSDYTVEHFHEVLEPFFGRVKKSELRKPGSSHRDLHDIFVKALRHQFSLAT
jgi:hypothetical protein